MVKSVCELTHTVLIRCVDPGSTKLSINAGEPCIGISCNEVER